MLRDYRDWLESEIKLLGNNTHHAYASGQANMAQRALARFEADTGATLSIGISTVEARRALTAIDMLVQQTTAEQPDLIALREAIKAALAEAVHPAAAAREPLGPEIF
jgi:hypothetical protein